MQQFIRYSDDLEALEAGEQETIQKIIDVHIKGMHIVRDRDGESQRISHAKAFGFVKGELVVDDNLPPELKQGLFAQPGSHPVVVRMAMAPGEVLDDRKVSTPRGLAIKVLDVQGDLLPGHTEPTQDFVLNNGKTFVVGSAKAFLAMFSVNATVAPKLPEGVKGATSTVSLATNTALGALGMNSPKLDFFGHPKYHPLTESYFSQVPIRYGDYIAKLGVTPASPLLRELYQQALEINDENGLRTAVVKYFRENDAQFDINIQLCTDLKKMPIEDSSVEWPEEVSPYRKVARLVLPRQAAYDKPRQEFVDYNMSFSPAHALAAHRPLGSIMRARLATYPALATLRRQENNKPLIEPTSLGQIPD